MTDWLKPHLPCNNPWSPRTVFLWNVLLHAEGPVLDIGCANDPLKFESRVTHFDIDDWSALYYERDQEFVQGDAQFLLRYFDEDSFDTVLLGDVVEHLVAPYQVLAQAVKVSSRAIAFTIWEETTIADGPGFWLSRGQAACDAEARKQGAEDREDWQRQHYPERVGVDDSKTPHLAHIWQFDDDMVDRLLFRLQKYHHVKVEFFEKVKEVTHEEYGDFYNWLVLLEKQ